jgi:hypothetical protein
MIGRKTWFMSVDKECRGQGQCFLFGGYLPVSTVELGGARIRNLKWAV